MTLKYVEKINGAKNGTCKRSLKVYLHSAKVTSLSRAFLETHGAVHSPWCQRCLLLLGVSPSISGIVKVYLYWCESESDVASRLVHRGSNLMFTLRSDKDQRKNFTQCK